MVPLPDARTPIRTGSRYQRPERGPAAVVYNVGLKNVSDRAEKGDVTIVSELPGPSTVLVVDDDDEVRRMLARALGAEGFQVEAVADARAALASVANDLPDLVVLDIVLGADDGLDVMAAIRRTSDVPIILLTGRGEEHERVLGLKLGADDYLVKPFSPAELAARITSVLRRSRKVTPGTGFDFGTLRIDVATREVFVHDEIVEMTAKEFDLLAFLAASPRQVFAREQLLRQVWESSSEWQDSATVTEHVRRVRRKIEDDPDSPRWVRTVRGVGYRFEP
jgi:DNA-binding response OmpR family regulator